MDYEVIWRGDVHGRNRGQLVVPADDLRHSTEAAPILGDWREPQKPEEYSALSARIKEWTNTTRQMLRSEALSARQISDRLGCQRKDAQCVLMRLRREGSLQTQLLTRAEQRLRGLKQASQIYRVRPIERAA
jgi:hypothetical protein